MGLDEKLSSDVVVSTLINLSQKIRGLVFIPLITKILGTAAYGAFVQVEIVARTFALLSRLGFDRGLIRYSQGRTDEERGQLYISLLLMPLGISSLFTASIIVMAGPISAIFLSTQEYALLFKIGALLVPIYVAQVMAQNWYRAEMNIKWYSILEGLKTYLKVATVIAVLFVADLGLASLIAAIVIVEGSFAVLLQGAVLRRTGLHWPTTDGFEEYLRYSLPTSLTDLAGRFHDRADRLLLGFFLGASAVGIYSVAYTVAKLLRIYVLPLRLAFFPEFSRLWEAGQQEECYRYLADGSRYFLGLAIPSIVGLYLTGGQVIGWLSTSEAAEQAPLLLSIIALGIVWSGLETLLRQILYADGDTKTPTIIHVTSTLFNIGLNIALIPIYGIIGAAFATLLSYFLTFSVLYAIATRRFDIDLEGGFTIRAVAAAGIMFAVVTLLGVQHVIALLVSCPIIYGSLLVLFGGIELDELAFIARSIRSTFTRG